MSHDIVPTHLVVKAMRDNGYKNAAYAIAELMDNSIQAGANRVELLCREETEMVQTRRRTRVKEIAVLDNGNGMDATTLRMALQFGNGTHLDEANHDGIGRFGMGLPNSSVSQCQRVDVWSWQNGIENALHTFIDLKEIEQNRQSEVPEPVATPIPEVWIDVGHGFGMSGTLVVWSKIDRCLWRTANSVIHNSEFLIGRMYRNFLNDGRVRIRMVAFEVDGNDYRLQERDAVANDPSYLMSSTSCPEPFATLPMFEQWGDEKTFNIAFRGGVHPVRINFSIAKQNARIGYGRNPGDLPHGKHAAKNVGVSIVRAERELDLDLSWSNPSEPRDRWWGVGLSFPPALDDLFGVTNNKQAARHFSELAKVDLTSLLEEGQSLAMLHEEMSADEDPQYPLIQIAHHIRSNISSMAAVIRAQTEGSRKENRRHDVPAAEKRGTEIIRERIKEGYTGESDQQEASPADVRQVEILNELVQEGVATKTAEELAAKTVTENLKFTFAFSNLNTPAFFDVKSRGGSMIVSLNVNHPAYSHLIEIVNEEADSLSVDDLRAKFDRTREGLKLLLMAWARYEDETPDGPRRTRVTEARWEWGRYARYFLDGE